MDKLQMLTELNKKLFDWAMKQEIRTPEDADAIIKVTAQIDKYPYIKLKEENS